MTKNKIREVEIQILNIEEKIAQVKVAMSGLNKSNEDDFETSDVSIASPVCGVRRKINTNPFANGTASGGILYHCSEPLIEEFKVNNIGEYIESPKNNLCNDEVISVMYETSENFGCCRSRFFCF